MPRFVELYKAARWNGLLRFHCLPQPEQDLLRFFVLAQPYNDLLCFGVDLPHLTNLMHLLDQIFLIDAKGIGPKKDLTFLLS
jgi:hypothetical protein